MKQMDISDQQGMAVDRFADSMINSAAMRLKSAYETVATKYMT